MKTKLFYLIFAVLCAEAGNLLRASQVEQPEVTTTPLSNIIRLSERGAAPPHEILGIANTADQETIKNAFERLTSTIQEESNYMSNLVKQASTIINNAKDQALRALGAKIIDHDLDERLQTFIMQNVDVEVVESLLSGERSSQDKIPDVNAKNRQGLTPLMRAADKKSRLDILSLLIAHGADLNIRDDNNGFTALMRASKAGNFDAVQQLIAARANQEIRNIENQTARDLTEDKNAYDKAVVAGINSIMIAGLHQKLKKATKASRDNNL